MIIVYMLITKTQEKNQLRSMKKVTTNDQA